MLTFTVKSALIVLTTSLLLRVTVAQNSPALDIHHGLHAGTVVYDRDNAAQHSEYLAVLTFFNNFLHVDELPKAAYPKYLVKFNANSTIDVPKLIRFANHADLRVSARSGGYQSAYDSVIDVVDDNAAKRKDFILLDFGDLKKVEINAAKRRVIVQPGVTYHELWTETIKYGLHFPGPHTERVNVFGFALGGGFGYGSRSLGSGADNIEAAEIVTSYTPEFTPIRVNRRHYPDLFYGIRGAGKFFGIVTELTFKLHPLVPNPPSTPSLQASDIKITEALSIFSAIEAKKVLDFYGDFDYTAPTNLETEIVFTSDQSGNLEYILASRNYAKEVSATTKAALQQITDFTNTLPNFLNLNTAIGYDTLQTNTDSSWDYANIAYYAEDVFAPAPLPDGLKKALIDRWSVVPSVNSTIVLNTGTWTLPSFAPNSLGFNKTYSLAIYSTWARTGNDTFDKLNVDWLKGTIDAIKPWTLGYYINELEERMSGDKYYYQKCYESATWDKLKVLKSKYDPLGLFRSLTGSV